MDAACKEPTRCSSIKAKDARNRVRDQQSHNGKKDGQDQLWKSIPAETSKELRSCFVADSKQEQKEERCPKNTGYNDAKLSHRNSREKAPDNRAQRERADPKPAQPMAGG